MVGKKKTIFVLGAGASKPYGYPIGNELKKEIIDLKNDGQVSLPGVLSELISDENPYLAFTDAFKKSGKFTIDEFLRTQTPFREIGKFAIAYLLLKKENSENYFRDDWVQILWDRISRNVNHVNQMQEASIGFITFNYDFSLEHILFEAIKNTFPGATDIDAKTFFDGIPIIHVHGRIKKFPWEEGYKKEFNKFGLSDLGLLDVLEMSKGIKLVHENDSNNEIIRIRELISQAENIVFLGFGFHQENIVKLNEIKSKWVQQNVPSAKISSPRKLNTYRNPARPNEISFRVGVPPVVTGTNLPFSVFSEKKLFATGVKMGSDEKTEAKKIMGLQNLNFVNHGSIDEFLRASINGFL